MTSQAEQLLHETRKKSKAERSSRSESTLSTLSPSQSKSTPCRAGCTSACTWRTHVHIARLPATKSLSLSMLTRFPSSRFFISGGRLSDERKSDHEKAASRSPGQKRRERNREERPNTENTSLRRGTPRGPRNNRPARRFVRAGTLILLNHYPLPPLSPPPTASATTRKTRPEGSSIAKIHGRRAGRHSPGGRAWLFTSLDLLKTLCRCVCVGLERGEKLSRRHRRGRSRPRDGNRPVRRPPVFHGKRNRKGYNSTKNG